MPHVISKLLITQWTQRTKGTAKTSGVCVLCAVFVLGYGFRSVAQLYGLKIHVSDCTTVQQFSYLHKDH